VPNAQKVDPVAARVKRLEAAGARVRLSAEGDKRILGIRAAGRDAKVDVVADVAAECPDLEELSFYQTKAADTEFARLSGLKRLKEVRISETAVAAEGTGHLAKLPALERLWLVGSNLTDEGLEPLRACRSLKRLNLSRTRVTGKGVATLKALPTLMELDLTQTRVDDEGMRFWRSCPGWRCCASTTCA
jgi:hypothetical protein